MRSAARTFALRLVVLASLLLAAGIAALGVDCSIAQWFCHGNGLKYLHQLATMCEAFGRGECVLLVALLIWRLDRSRRWAAPAVASIGLLSGLAADVVKMLIVRARPHSFDFAGGVMSTFGPWLPLTTAGSPGQSFPSAHTATAVGLAIALMWLYPSARALFCVLPFLVAYQRMDSGAHFLSDVLCGAAVGCVVGALCLRAQWLDREYALETLGRMKACFKRLAFRRVET